MTRVLIQNGKNITRDYGIQKIPSYLIREGVEKFTLDELAVTENEVAAGVAYIRATRTNVDPEEVFLIPVQVDEPVVIDTSQVGFVIISLDQAKINDGSGNAVDGSGIATVEVVEELPEKNYILLATITSEEIDEEEVFTISDNRIWAVLSDNAKPDHLYYADDEGEEDAYIIQANAVKSLHDGLEVNFKAATSNTGPCTLQINDFAPKPLRRRDNEELAAGDLLESYIMKAVYNLDLDVFQVIGPLANDQALIEKSTEQEVRDQAKQTGSNNDKYVTPLRVDQYFDEKMSLTLPCSEDVDGSEIPKLMTLLKNKSSKTENYTSPQLINHFYLEAGNTSAGLPIGSQATSVSRGQVIRFTGAGQGSGKLKSFNIQMGYAAPPNDNIRITIYNIVDGLPSEPIANGVSSSVSIDTSNANNGEFYVFNFPTPPDLELNKDYALILSRTGSLSLTNYATPRRRNGQGVDVVNYQYNTLTEVWIATNDPRWYMFGFLDDIVYNERLCLASDEAIDRRNFIGFCDSNVEQGQNAKVNFPKIYKNDQLDLEVGEVYYLGTNGEIVLDRDIDSVILGSVGVAEQVFKSRPVVGVAISENEILFDGNGPNVAFYQILIDNPGKINSDISIFLESGFTPKEVFRGQNTTVASNAGPIPTWSETDRTSYELKPNGVVIRISSSYSSTATRLFFKITG